MIPKQCKDIPELPILEFLYQRKLDDKVWSCWYEGFENSIDQAMPENTHWKLRVAKMAKLIKRGLISGCGCGCRGDYEITSKGIDYYLWHEYKRIRMEDEKNNTNTPFLYLTADGLRIWQMHLQKQINSSLGMSDKDLETYLGKKDNGKIM